MSINHLFPLLLGTLFDHINEKGQESEIHLSEHLQVFFVVVHSLGHV